MTIVKHAPKIGLIWLALFLLLPAACADAGREDILMPGFGSAEVSFVAHTDMAAWIEDASDLRWGVAISRRDIVKTTEADGLVYHQPAIDLADVDRFVLVDAFKTGETITISVRPGVYDWLIVMDHTNDGVWDSYLGARSPDVQLDQMAFAANTRYRVIVGEDGIPRLEK